MTDSDQAENKATWKSMSSYLERFGQHVIDASCNHQSVVALSSGEAEFYAITREAYLASGAWCLLCPVSCLMSRISSLASRVWYYILCLVSRVSWLLFRVSCL